MCLFIFCLFSSSRSASGDSLSVALFIRTLSMSNLASLGALDGAHGVALSGEKTSSGICLATFGLGGHII